MPTVIPVNLGFVYAYIVKGCNHSIIVDCGFPGEEKKILRALRENNISKESISLIIITHADPDHYGSVFQLKHHLQVPVLVHLADNDVLRTGTVRRFRATGPIGHLMKVAAGFITSLRMRRYIPVEPDIIMQTGSLSLQPYGIDGYLLHTPGETPGSISVVLNSGQVIVGDLIGGTFPHSTTPAYAPFSDNISDVKNSLAKILSLHPTIIYTGHSKPIDVKKHNGSLQSLAGK